MRFTTGEGGSETVECQILQPDVVQESQALADFGDKNFRDRGLLRSQLDSFKKARRSFYRHAANLAYIAAIDLDLPRFRAQARSSTRRTQRISPVTAQKHADVELVFLSLQALEESADSRKPVLAIHNYVLIFRAEFIPRHIQRNFSQSREAFEFREQRAIFRFGPGLNRTFIQSLAFVGDDQIEIEINGVAEPLAARTRSIGIVEGEQPRLRLIVSASVVLTFEALRKAEPLKAFALARSRLEDDFSGFAIPDFHRVDDPRTSVRCDHQAVNQCEDRLRKIHFQQRFRTREFKELPALKQAIEATFAKIEETGLDRIRGKFGVGFCLFLAANLLGRLLSLGAHRLHGKQHVEACSFRQREQTIRNFVDRVLLHFLSADHAIGAANAREQEAQVVEDFRCSGYRRARITRRILLLDRNRGRDAVNQIRIRLFDALQKLARIRRQRFHIPALPFGINRVESERRFAGTRHTRDDRQLVVRDFKIDVLEVVNPGPANNNAFRRHLPLSRLPPSAEGEHPSQAGPGAVVNLSIIKGRRGVVHRAQIRSVATP